MIKPMELLSEIEKRKTVINFSDREIEQPVLDRILDAGRLAPSAKNRQPWRFIVIRDKSLKNKIRDVSYGDDRFSQAPVAVAVCTTNIDYKMPNGELSYPIDISFATSFMMLQAEHEDIGSAIITTYQEDKVKNILTVPYSMKVVMILLLGYSGERETHNIRLPKERVVAYNHW